jgi:hypothetical protein
MAKGAIIAESLRIGTELNGVPLLVRRISRFEVTVPGPDQPEQWTLIEFDVPDDHADRLAASLADALLPKGGWYADFHTDTHAYVVFADRIFRYLRGDHAARMQAQQYGRDAGVPEGQLDWAD